MYLQEITHIRGRNFHSRYWQTCQFFLETSPFSVCFPMSYKDVQFAETVEQQSGRRRVKV